VVYSLDYRIVVGVIIVVDVVDLFKLIVDIVHFLHQFELIQLSFPYQNNDVNGMMNNNEFVNNIFLFHYLMKVDHQMDMEFVEAKFRI
jgi:hypothetical protein